MRRYLQRFLSAPEREAIVPASLVEEGAQRFMHWVGAQTDVAPAYDDAFLEAANGAINRYHESSATKELPESFAADTASYLGEFARRRWPGSNWLEHSIYGFVIGSLAGLPHARLLVLPLVERKWKRNSSYSLPEFFISLGERIAAEQQLKPANGTDSSEIAAGLAMAPSFDAAAQREAEEFRRFWQQRHGQPLPITLVGLREVDMFLRTNYYANFLSDAMLVRAGFFTGEVARGLFGGAWDFAALSDCVRAPLRFPELDYYPVGRIFKMMTELPEGEPLDEYVRLIPSARMEMKKGGHSS